MDEEKKKFKFKIPAVSFRLLLTIVFIVLGITPVFIYGRMVSRTNLSSRIDARKIELQTKGLMLIYIFLRLFIRPQAFNL